MAVDDTAMSLHLDWINPLGRHESIQECSAAGPGLAIHEPERFAGEIFDLTHVFGIFGSDHEPLFPMGERDDTKVLVWKFLPDEGKIKLTCFGIFKMSPGNMDPAFFEPGEGQFARSCRWDDLNTTDLFDH